MDIDTDRMPNLIVPGGQKCGSSALAHFLALHPDCVLSDPKEPSFFSRERNMMDLPAYCDCFREQHQAKVLFDASTGYLFESYVPDRIRRILLPIRPDLKILIVLRRPVDRAISAYMHLKKRFDDHRSLFDVFGDLPDKPEDIFAVEQHRIEHSLAHGVLDVARYKYRYDDCLWQFRYLRNSWYTEFVRAFQETIGSDQVKVIFTEELAHHPYDVMTEVFDFVDLSPFHHAAFGNKINPTLLPPGMDIFARTKLGPLGWLLKRFSNKLLPHVGIVHAPERNDQESLDRLCAELDEVLAMQYTELSGLVNRDVARIWPRFNDACPVESGCGLAHDH